VTWQDPVKNLIATRWLLFFLLKQRRFDLKKKLTRATRWPNQNPELGPWTRPGLKTIIRNLSSNFMSISENQNHMDCQPNKRISYETSVREYIQLLKKMKIKYILNINFVLNYFLYQFYLKLFWFLN
jgi:hypothetical protein